MILASHVIVGVAVARVFPSHPALAFSAALASHYAMDAIPHWDYHLLSTKMDLDNPINDDITIDRNFISDLKKILFDMVLGTSVSFLLFYFFLPGASVGIFIAGIVGGVAPDILQFAYFRLRREPFKSLYLFHQFVHSRTRELKEHLIVGIFLQIFVVALVVFFVRFFQ